jgi:hypothetical protein
MKKLKLFVFAAALLCGGLIVSRSYAADDAAPAKKSAAELEKEKALSNPYPNDFGPATLDSETLKSYPEDKVAGYKLLLVRCAQCHTPSRPLNSRFVEPDPGEAKPAERDAKEGPMVEKLKADHPDYFKNPAVWQIEASVWNRYVKRMLSKPGCGVDVGGHMTKEEAAKIYKFLVYDGQRRKLGENAEKWKAHREELVTKLKTEKPARYEELKKDNDL